MKRFAALTAALAIAAFAPPGRAAAPHHFHPNATTCTFNSATMAFGAYAPLGANLTTPLEATGNVKIRCTSGGAYTLTADNGANAANASGTCATAACSRAMNSGTSYVPYDLYTSSSYTTVWNSTNGIAGIGTNGAQTIDVYGYVPPGIASAAGTYGDTINVTATF